MTQNPHLCAYIVMRTCVLSTSQMTGSTIADGACFQTAFQSTDLQSCMQILVIALLMRFILKRHFTIWQWEALVLLMAGITVNQLSSCG